MPAGRTFIPVESRSAPGESSRARPWRPALLAGVSQIVASQIALGLVGVLTLPVLGRTLGPARYGDFSLFLTLLGVVTYQDVARQLLIHEQSKERVSPADVDALTRLSTVLIVALAIGVGAFVLEPPSALALVAVTLLHGLSSRDYASLAISGRVGAVTALRNFAWVPSSVSFFCSPSLRASSARTVRPSTARMVSMIAFVSRPLARPPN